MAHSGRTYAINRFFSPVPIHLVGCGLSLDHRAAGVRGAAAVNPHGSGAGIPEPQRCPSLGHCVEWATLPDTAQQSGPLAPVLPRIRSRNHLGKVLDIYATSIDYDPNTDISREFFSVVQNKMHWAAHGHTAAEIIAGRANADSPNMGLTTWTGDKPRKADVAVAKNYLNERELDILNRIVNFYLEFAELQALEQRPMYMKDWITRLDDFLKLSGRDILDHAGSVSHQQALDKAHAKYEQYRLAHLNDASPVEKHFLKAVSEMKQIEQGRKSTKGKKGE